MGPRASEFFPGRESAYDALVEFCLVQVKFLLAGMLREGALAWKPLPTYPSRACSQQLWDIKVEKFCKYEALDKWEIVAEEFGPCDGLLSSFLDLLHVMLFLLFVRNAVVYTIFWCI